MFCSESQRELTRENELETAGGGDFSIYFIGTGCFQNVFLAIAFVNLKSSNDSLAKETRVCFN